MGREIELKIPLTDEQYDSILGFLNGKTTVQGVEKSDVTHFIKKDSYFSRYDTDEERKKNGEPKVIRIRTQQLVDDKGTAAEKKTYFCVKYKKIENDVEFNSENETAVEDEQPLQVFFSAAGYKQYFEKNKDSYSAYCRMDIDREIEFHLELVIVNGHKYLETEVTQSQLEADRIRVGLEAFVQKFGLDAAKKDSRSWMEITGAK